MKPFAVLCATRQGHTRQIAERVAATIRRCGEAATAIDVRTLRSSFDVGALSGAVVAASVHLGSHEPEMIVFAKRHAAALGRIPTAFVSVSLAEATATDPTRTAKVRAEATRQVRSVIDNFLDEETRWRPRLIEPVAGALLYTKYGIMERFIMKTISRLNGGPVDTSRDYDFTDWHALDKFTARFLEEAALDHRC